MAFRAGGSGWAELVFAKAVTSVRSPKMKRDASVKVVFFLSKKTTFTEASLFIFGQRTDVTDLPSLSPVSIVSR